MKSLNEDLKTGQFKQVYLLYGEEAYLKKQYKERLKKAMTAPDDTMNFSYYEGKDINPREIIDLAETMPFFADRRLIVIENSGFFKNASPELAEYLRGMPDTTNMIFIESELDKRGKLFKAVKDCGRVVELPRQDDQTLFKWILGSMKRENKQVAPDTVKYLLSKVGSDMENLQRELEKLYCYTLERDAVTPEDIDKVCTVHITNQIFDMVDSVARKEQKKALDYYYDLLALKEPPMRILFLLSRQFKILLEVKDLERRGHEKKEIASKAGVPPFTVGKYQSQARAFKMEELRAILEESAQTEEAVKTGRLGDMLAVELFICSRT